ncbi:unannotated protein [freshwater metagenome]|uniref:Unannotated protein n=1 Tax=freshwater metagenome TaxID=449393 RepID=A0A6J7FNP8_9ZZZZ|nr:hypothetical protein [Actinomycetota bacterium]
MADDDDTIDPEDEILDPEAEEPEDVDPELDPDELDEEELDADDEFSGIDDEFVDAAGAEEAEDDTDGPVRRAVASDDDDDDDMLAPDDVEADLDTILKDRLVSADDSEDEDDEPEDRSEASDRLQPKRSDERLCPSCFLLVRNGAPTCPIGDDDCPLLSKKKKK